MALTKFYVINSVVPYHALLGRPWLHRHKLVPSTYHQCVKGRFLGKPICIPVNHTLFDLSEAHYFEAYFYNEFTPCGEDATPKRIGTPLPNWEVIKKEPDVDLRGILDQKKKKRECKEASSSGHNWGACKSNYRMGTLVTDYDNMWGLTVSNRRVPD